MLYRQYMSDPNAPLYVEMDDLVPDFKTASSIIREAGGFVSGGSDFHGTCRSEVDIGTGFGNLQIPTDTILNWVKQINFYNKEDLYEQTNFDFSR